MVNFGIIPAVGSHFMVYFLCLPPALSLFTWEISTYIPLMGLFLCVTLIMALTGGFLTIMVANCVEGEISRNCCFFEPPIRSHRDCN